MAGNEWEKFGDEIRKTVQDAIENQDFHRLNQNITDTVDRAMGTVFHNASERMKQARGRTEEYTANQWNSSNGNAGVQYGGSSPNSRYGGTSVNGQYGQPGRMNAGTVPERGHPDAYRQDASDRGLPSVYYKKPSGANIQGVLLGIVGGWFGIPFACTSIYGLVISFIGGFHLEYFLVSILCILIAFGGLWVMKSGINLCGLQKRFMRMVRGIGSREYCDVKELSAMIGRTEAKTVKDLQKMSLKGWFKQPHFDESKKCFMTSDRMYQEYMRLEGQRKEEEAKLEKKRIEAQNRAKEMDAKLPPEVRQVIEAGDAFIQKIHACNDAIPGEEISAKISRMEMLVDRIFDRVEQDPETISDVRRLMDYYLPTTVKLLEAYQDLDSQPVAGENIKASKLEIEATLDTLNQAFEKILDDLFHQTAWDVSSDISVLNTMLAREGLKDEGIKLS